MAVILLFYLLSYAAYTTCTDEKRPNIVIVVGDDIGYNDISLHGSDEIQTSNIDMLGYQGVIFDQYYTDCFGTASASALLTGKYPMRLGAQGPSIGAAEDRGVPINEKLLSGYLEELGYATHYVGRWSLGSSRPCYLPTKRNFKSFYGFRSSVDYYTYNHMETYNGTDFYGRDLYENETPVTNCRGYLTNVLTERAVNIIKEHNTSTPLYLHIAHAAAHIGGGLVNLQAPQDDVFDNMHIAHPARLLYASMVTNLDKSLGILVQALQNYGLLENTIILFVCDNGSPTVNSPNYGSNMPLRGTKGTPWEGAIRSTAVMWYQDLSPKIFKGMFHVSDWVPTFIAAAGGIVPSHLDGINQWDSIVNDLESKRHHAVLAVDDLNNWAAFRDGDMKLIVGTVPKNCGYYGHELHKISHSPPDYKDKLLNSLTYKVFTEDLNMGLDVAYALEKRDLCNINKKRLSTNSTLENKEDMCIPDRDKPCLYNITADPEESHDLSKQYPKIVSHMGLRLRLLWGDLVPRPPPSFNLNADPSRNNYMWGSWMEDEDEWPASVERKPDCPLKQTTEEFNYFMTLNARVMKYKLWHYMSSLTNAYVSSISGML